MKKKRKKLEGEPLNLEVYDREELVLEENLQAITTIPHENRGIFVKELMKTSKSPLRTRSASFIQPVDIESGLIADYPILFFKAIADQFHSSVPDLNWGGSKYY